MTRQHHQPAQQASPTLPFLKWAGGKQRLLAQYAPHFPPLARVNRYFEPFIGSAAVFFHLQLPKSTLSDQNGKLIELYRTVQKDVDGVIRSLKKHRNEKNYYYHIRAHDPESLSPADRAARLIYLNKTCYNGLYRENKKGKFNVPFGRYRNPTICDEGRLKAAAQALRSARLTVADFEQAVSRADRGDFIYFDPPYVPLTSTSNFTSYNSKGFTDQDHRRLAETILQLTKKGCFVMLSNSSADLVYTLYQGHGYRLLPIQARRNINSKANKRGSVTELLILNYDPSGNVIELTERSPA
jgi:DNA adenine methylase